jgi:hypothetical protein
MHPIDWDDEAPVSEFSESPKRKSTEEAQDLLISPGGYMGKNDERQICFCNTALVLKILIENGTGGR